MTGSAGCARRSRTSASSAASPRSRSTAATSAKSRRPCSSFSPHERTVVVNAFQPYSGTKLRKICIEKGLIPKEERAEDYRIYGSFYNGAISAQELENIRKCFSLYITFPKSRWPEIRKAETDDRIFNALMKEYKDKEMLNRKNRESIPNSIHGNIEANEVFINDQESVVV